jgi:hypothetical protein
MAEHQVMSCGTGITAINATSCRKVGYCWWNNRFHCLFMIRDRNRHTSDFSRRTKLVCQKLPYEYDDDVRFYVSISIKLTDHDLFVWK